MGWAIRAPGAQETRMLYSCPRWTDRSAGVWMILDLLLLADALLLLGMGGVLGLLPAGMVATLGLPSGQPALYRRLFGGALLGLGLALIMNALPSGLSGLGPDGAIAANLAIGLILALQLLTGAGKLPARSKRLLWAVVLALLAIAGGLSLAN